MKSARNAQRSRSPFRNSLPNKEIFNKYLIIEEWIFLIGEGQSLFRDKGREWSCALV